METSSDENDAFEDIMQQVGDSGRFQKIYNILFNFVFVSIATLATFSPIISVAIPDHWCKVPGRELTNFSVEEWKNLTIPWKSNESQTHSQCTMFNKTTYDTHTLEDNDTIIDCIYGWEYNQTYYTLTIATQENWVCNQQMYGTNFLVFGKIGEIIGTLFLPLGDIYGRRPVIYVSIVILVIGRLGLLVSNGIYLLFVAFSIIGSLPSLSVYQTPLIVSVEISSVKDRTSIPLLQCLGWTIGLCVGPMIFWAFGDWISFTWISTLPLLLFLFTQAYLIESPRWLASRGEMKKCAVELKKIAKINKNEISDKLLTSLDKYRITPEKNYGVMGLFASWNLAKKSILVIISWTCHMMIYIIIFLNVSNLEGNPFLNYLWQGIAELPGYFLGKYMCDTIGRKLTRFVSFIGLLIVSIILAYVLTLSGYVITISVCGSILKFLCSVVFYAINLQTLEIYPTCLRQTGSSMGFLVANIFGIFIPYIIYMGTALHPSYPYVFSAILAIFGALSGIWLPETFNEKLPETISEAENFGTDQKLWSLPKGTKFTHKAVPNKIV